MLDAPFVLQKWKKTDGFVVLWFWDFKSGSTAPCNRRMSIYTPSDKAVAAPNVPHLLHGPHGELELYSNRFNLSVEIIFVAVNSSAIIGGVGIAVVITFVIAILLRLLLLTCKLFTRKCIPGAEKCKLCCVCCRKGCTHPESRCSKCCCCYRAVTEISRVQAETSVSTQLVWHNKRRTWLLELHAATLVLPRRKRNGVFWSTANFYGTLFVLSTLFVRSSLEL